MDTLPLPPRADLEQYRTRAKNLVKACASSNSDAVRAWAREWLEALARSLDLEITPFVQGSFDRALDRIEQEVRTTHAKADGGLKLTGAQFLIARAHGFESWPKFVSHIQRLHHVGSDDREFEAAADTVIAGDVTALESLIRSNPALVRARSTREHHATLLHYVAANGVEDFRQRSPKNAAAVARLLLTAGAEVDALADTYGGGPDQTTMNLLVSSAHPAGAGVQAEVAETLLDFGAAIDGVANDESPLLTALAFGYENASAVLVRRGARIDSVVTAAAVGREDLVRQFVVDARTLRTGVPLVAPRWIPIPATAESHIELAFIWACKFGQAPIVRFLLEKGVNPSATLSDGMTGLHWAAGGRYADIVTMLLKAGAPLETRNRWGGTVLDALGWFIRHQPVDDPLPPGEVDYPEMVKLLLDAGADARQISPFPTGNAAVDVMLREKGAQPL